jgi:TonB family protein
MRGLACLLAMLALTGGMARAQQEPLEDGPMTVPASNAQTPAVTPQSPNTTPAAQDSPAVPDVNGIYRRGAGLMLPMFVDAPQVKLPADAPPAEPPRNSILSLTVGVDGIPTGIKVLRSLNSEADKTIVDALSMSMFEPGTLDGKPVPMEVEVVLHFFSDTGPAVPHVRWSGAMQTAGRGPFRRADGITQPKLIHHREAEFTELARKNKKQGTVTISFVVTEEGLPSDLKVVKGVGWGLDEKALESVSQYRFEPATKDGKPVPYPMSVEVNFHLY